MFKKISVVGLVMLAFVAGIILPRPSGLQDQKSQAAANILKKDQKYKAGPYMIWYRVYRGKGGTTYKKIDIVGKHNLKGAIYKNGATIEERK